MGSRRKVRAEPVGRGRDDAAIKERLNRKIERVDRKKPQKAVAGTVSKDANKHKVDHPRTTQSFFTVMVVEKG